MNREAILKLLLPALLVSFVYWVAAPNLLPSRWGDKINPTAAAARARGQLDAERGRAPTPAQLLAEARGVADLTDEVDALRTRKADLEKKWAALTAARSSGAKRADLLARIEGVLTSKKLTPVEQGVADGGARMPASLKAAIDKINPNDPDAGRLYKFKFRGRYAEVSAALDELAGRDWPVIPVGMTMDEADLVNPVRTWALFVWM